MKRTWIVLLALTITGCSESAFDSSTPSMGDSVAMGNGQGSAGTLTSGLWDDNRNFDFFNDFRDALLVNNEDIPNFSDAEHESAHDKFNAEQIEKTTLDVALVVDTTGSMGDEISFLKAEFESIVRQLQAAHPNAEQRWALTVYRDEEDEYLIKSVDFTADLEVFEATLEQMSAGGGGDFPEASHLGLEKLSELNWRTGDENARLAFWLADAPHHSKKTRAVQEAITVIKNEGIHLYPVASSGTDKTTEGTMRIAAQLTGGRYIFLTDDSGVGGSHIEPTVPCYFVTKLDNALLRVIDIELSGNYYEPDAADIIRTGGDPTNGLCTLDGGEIVQVF